jgi:Putative mono-oxygenase ydhR
MHAVLITFSSAATPAEVAEPFEQYAQLLLDVPGLIGKTWLTADSVLGGFHLFESDRAASDYLTGPLFEAVLANPAFSDFRVVPFDVLESLSAVTNGVGSARLALDSSSRG